MVPLDPLVDPSMGLAVSRIQFVEKAVVFSCFSGRSHCMQRTHYTIKEMRLIKSSDWDTGCLGLCSYYYSLSVLFQYVDTEFLMPK